MDWHENLESDHRTMSEESPNLGLEQLTEQVAEQILFTVGSATCDPKQAVMRLLRQYLEQAQEQTHDDVLGGQQLEEHDQQN